MTDATKQRDCAYCPELGADVCVRTVRSASGSDHSVYAHRACAQLRGIKPLYELTPSLRLEAEHFG